MNKETQISAIVSETTRERMERYTRRTGVKKGYLIEQALLHHLQALDELPLDVVVHPRIVVSQKTAEAMLETRRARPTPALRKLMRRGD